MNVRGRAVLRGGVDSWGGGFEAATGDVLCLPRQLTMLRCCRLSRKLKRGASGTFAGARVCCLSTLSGGGGEVKLAGAGV